MMERIHFANYTGNLMAHSMYWYWHKIKKDLAYLVSVAEFTSFLSTEIKFKSFHKHLCQSN